MECGMMAGDQTAVHIVPYSTSSGGYTYKCCITRSAHREAEGILQQFDIAAVAIVFRMYLPVSVQFQVVMNIKWLFVLDLSWLNVFSCNMFKIKGV